MQPNTDRDAPIVHSPEVLAEIDAVYADLPRLLYTQTRKMNLKSLTRYFPTYEDAVQAAAVGVARAVKTYDRARCPKFLTWALWNVRRSMQEDLQKFDRSAFYAATGTRNRGTPVVVTHALYSNSYLATASEPEQELDATQNALACEKLLSLASTPRMAEMLRLRYMAGMSDRELAVKFGLTRQRCLQLVNAEVALLRWTAEVAAMPPGSLRETQCEAIRKKRVRLTMYDNRRLSLTQTQTDPAAQELTDDHAEATHA